MAKTFLKVAFSLAIILYLSWQVPLDRVVQALQEMRPGFILIASVLYLMAQLLSAYKWALLSRPLGFQQKFNEMAGFYFIGMFFNLFMLGSIGGDIVRAYYLGWKTRRVIPAGYSIFMERYTGALTLVAILSIALIIPLNGKAIPTLIRWPIIAGAITIWLVTIFMPNLLNLFPVIKKWGERIHLQEMKIYWETPGTMRMSLMISFVFQTLFITIIIIIALGFGIKIPLHYFFILVPMGDLLSILPLTLNGIGIREGCYVLFLHWGGVDTSTSLAFALLCLVVVWGVSLIGGIVYLFRGFGPGVKGRTFYRELRNIEVKT